MKERTSQLLYAYWNDVRGDRVAPRRFDIEPSRITAILPDTFILERLSRADYAFRLAGTRLCELFGREFRGTNLLALLEEQADRETLERILEGVCREGAAGIVTLEARDRADRTLRLEMLLLPLVHSGLEISRVLGSLVASGVSPSPGQSTIVSPRLKTFNLVWPDGRPHALLERFDRQAPFVRGPKHSRIVHSERRSFRVYEGGLSEQDPTKP